MKTRYLWRNLRREIQHTLMRALSIFSISAIGVAFLPVFGPPDRT